jgi:hypothetical protein
MISTQHPTAEQLTQLEALLADTTAGGGLYRPSVARDVEVLQQLVQAGLALYVEDIGPTYEITDTGREIVIEHAMYAAEGAEFVAYAGDDELQATIEHLKAELPQLGDTLRQRAMADIEICQDELDRRAEVGIAVEGRSESSGRHQRVEPDDRPTETIDRVELPTEPLPVIGTLPSIPVAEILTDRDGAERLLAAIQDTPSPDDVAEYLAAPHTADEWAALAADLGDDEGWLRRNLTPRRVIALSVIASIVVTWFVAWLVMA